MSRPGSVTSMRSRRSRSSSSAAPSSLSRASSAPSSARRTSFSTLPRGPRWSGGSPPSSRSAATSGALRPSSSIRTCSSAAVSVLAAIAARPSCWTVSGFMSGPSVVSADVANRRMYACRDDRAAVHRMSVGVPTADAYAALDTVYDDWCRSVTEDIDFYVGLAIASGGTVLEVGVGSGRVAIPTALAGVQVVGVDRSAAMLDLAWAKALRLGVGLDLVQADMRALPELGRFPLVTVPFRAFLHLRDDAERLAVLRGLRERLQPGGLLAFDVFHPDRVDIEETQGRWLEREPGIRERADWDP